MLDSNHLSEPFLPTSPSADNLSLYGQYIREHRGDEIIENEYGFATFRYLNDKQVYIIDIYVVPEQRKNYSATHLAEQIAEIAVKRGCTEILGTVTPSAKNSTTSLKVLLGYGMSLQSASNDLVIFSKSIGNKN